MSDANYYPAKGLAPSGLLKAAHSAQASHALKKDKGKGMAKPERKFHKRYSLWVSEGEAKQIEEQASVAGLSVSECLRRRGFGGRPVVAQTDMNTIRELRRIGGLLKHHFETLREAGASRELLEQQEETLRILSRAIERLGSEKS